jgi:hypothetical protein
LDRPKPKTQIKLSGPKHDLAHGIT